MTHKDKGHFAGKHKSGQEVPPELAKLIRETLVEGRLSCAQAFAIAGQLSITPAQAGVAIDMMEVSIIQCQLGLFGYFPQRKIIKRLPNPPASLLEAIQECSNHSAISCADLWLIASRQGLPKLEAAGACETLGVKIRSCQLGAF